MARNEALLTVAWPKRSEMKPDGICMAVYVDQYAVTRREAFTIEMPSSSSMTGSNDGMKYLTSEFMKNEKVPTATTALPLFVHCVPVHAL